MRKTALLLGCFIMLAGVAFGEDVKQYQPPAADRPKQKM